MIPKQIQEIMDLARWAPSGDNTQPWRFEFVDEHHIVVHGFDTRNHCVYDLDGRPSQIALGGLLETLTIAASSYHLSAEHKRRPNLPEITPTFDVKFSHDPSIQPDPLLPFIPVRSVQRRPLSTRSLTPQEKSELESSVGNHYKILWLEGFSKKLQTALLLFHNAKLRLTMPEAYQVHKTIIQWGSRYSEDRVPDQALGVDPVTAHLMHWVMANWQRVDFFNTYLAGTWAPRLQMDFFPAMACAGHFLIISDAIPASVDDYVTAGQAMQRFWLTATRLGLQLQPEMTPLIFSRYVRSGIHFSATLGMHKMAESVSNGLISMIGKENNARCVFMGRVGAGSAAKARSIRQPLNQLWLSED